MTRPRRRTIIIAGTAVLGLLVLAAVIIQAVLLSDFPRQRAVAALERLTALDVEIQSASTSWLGTTVARDVTLRVPLEQTPILTAAEVRLEHSTVLGLVLGQKFRVSLVEVTSPELELRRMEHDRLNLASAIDLIARANDPSRGSGGSSDKKRETPVLPEVVIRDGAIRFPGDDDARRWTDIEVHGAPAPRDGGWTIRGALEPGVATFDGELFLSPMLVHDIHFNIEDPDNFLAAWGKQLPDFHHAEARWVGERGKEYHSRVELKDLDIAGYSAGGAIVVEQVEGAWRFRPEPMEAAAEQSSGTLCELAGGELRVSDEVIHASGLRFKMGSLEIVIDGEWQIPRRSGEVQVEWHGTVRGGDAIHSGKTRVTASLPEQGPQSFAAETSFEIRREKRHATGTFEIAGHGSSPGDLSATLSFPNLVFADEGSRADLSGLALEATRRDQRILFQGLTLPGARFSFLEGDIDLGGGAWHLDLEIADWRPPPAGPPIQATIAATGNGVEFAEVSQCVIEGERFAFGLAGSYLADTAPPLQAWSWLSISPSEGVNDTDTADGAAAEWDGDAELSVFGSLVPLDLRLAGNLYAPVVPLPGGHVELIRSSWEVSADTDTVAVTLRETEAFGGAWHLTASYPFSEKTLFLAVAGKEVAMERIAKLSGLPIEMDGGLAFRFAVLVPDLDPQRMTMNGDWGIGGTHRASYLEGATGLVCADCREVELDRITLASGDGSLQGGIRVGLVTPGQLKVAMKAARWPVTVAGNELAADVDLKVDAEMHFAARRITGDLRLAGEVFEGERSVGTIDAPGVFGGDVLDFERLEGDLLGGYFEGRARIPLRDIFRTRLELSWQDIDLAEIPIPQGANDLPIAGTVSGEAIIDVPRSSDDPEPGPERDTGQALACQLRVTPSEVTLHGLEVGEMWATATLYPGGAFLDQARVEFAGGVLEAWGQASHHEHQRYGYLHVTIESPLSLDQITLATKGKAIPGSITGEVGGGGYLEEPHRWFANGTLHLAKTDLATVPVVSHMYDALTLDLSPCEPTGHGSASIRLENQTLLFPHIYYYNRGSELVGQFVIENLSQGGQSPIRGVVAGTARPFYALKFDLVEDLDRALSALQADETTFRLGGVLSAPETEAVLFADVRADLKRILQAASAE